MSYETIRDDFGHRVRSLRRSRGMTQEQLAFRSGLHPTFLSRIERGGPNVTLETVGSIADGLSVRISRLFD
jgi:transcriptional regulator with XRE-family HTH domain